MCIAIIKAALLKKFNRVIEHLGCIGVGRGKVGENLAAEDEKHELKITL